MKNWTKKQLEFNLAEDARINVLLWRAIPITVPGQHACHTEGDRCLRCNLHTHVIARTFWGRSDEEWLAARMRGAGPRQP